MATPLTPAEDFIQSELQSFATFLVDRAKQQIIRRRLRVDDELLNSLATTTAKDGLNLIFKARGRFQDMGAGRYYHKGIYTGNRKDTSLLKGRKPRRWYSRTAYAAIYGTLINNLSNKYVALLVQGTRETLTSP